MALHDAHSFPVDAVAHVPRRTGHLLVIRLVAHHVVHAIVDEHGEFVLLTVTDEVVDEPPVQLDARVVPSRQRELHHGRALDVGCDRPVRVFDELGIQHVKVQALALAEVRRVKHRVAGGGVAFRRVGAGVGGVLQQHAATGHFLHVRGLGGHRGDQIAELLHASQR